MLRNLGRLKIIITGGDGFIGSYIVEKLVDLGSKVYCIVEPKSDLWRLEDVKDKIQILRYDICDPRLKKEIKKIRPRKAFHLASLVNPERDVGIVEDMFRINVNGTINFMSAFIDSDCDAIINTGTCEEYGDNKAPFREVDLPRPVSPYSASKVAATFYCQMLYHSFNVPIVNLRPFLTYGPKQTGDLFIPSLIRHILEGRDFEMTGGQQTREFNYVTDIADGFIKASVTQAAIGRVINIGCGKDYKIIDVASKIIELSGSYVKLKIGKLPYRKGEVDRFYCDNSLAIKILNWRPKVSLDEGLRRTIEWYKRKMY